MDSHPVPQDIKSFEFQLIGDMTLKQFAYLATGSAFGYLIFLLFGNSFPYLAIPLASIFAGVGAAFAFLPIMERSLDYWLVAFFRAIFKPTERAYYSSSFTIKDPQFNSRLRDYLVILNPSLTPTLPPSTTPITEVKSNLGNLKEDTEKPLQQTTSKPLPPQKSLPTDNSVPNANKPSFENELPTTAQLQKTVELAKEAQKIQTKIVVTEKELEGLRRTAAQPGADYGTFTRDFQKVLADLQNLNKKASEISKELASLAKSPSEQDQPVLTHATKAKIIPTLTLTSIPNIINGIVTDSEGNYIQGAIIVAHDKQGLPVRALKSNKLGQFIAATPLTPGEYTLSVEKDGLFFDTIQVELKDDLLKPIIVSAKKVKGVS